MVQTQMRAVSVVADDDGQRDLRLVTVGVPEPGPGEVMVRVMATALDRVDTFIRRGTHGMGGTESAPLGRDLAGVVEAIGPGVTEFRWGDRVLACGVGAHAEFAVAPAALTVPIPNDWNFIEAAALPTAGRTAYAAVSELAGIGRGDRVLVTAVGGGVGSAAVQLCLLLGAEVVGTVGSEWKQQRAREHGVSRVFRHDEAGWGKQLRAEVGPVDAVIETTGTAAWPEALAALRNGGTIVCCGVSTGHHFDLHLGQLMTRGWRLLGIGRPDQATVRSHMLATLRSFNEGRIRPVIDSVVPLSDSEQAHATLESSAFYGRIILTPQASTTHPVDTVREENNE